jgi:hypothetical protein
VIVKHRWHELLHNGAAWRLRRALRRQPAIVFATVPHHLATRLVRSAAIRAARQVTTIQVDCNSGV